MRTNHNASGKPSLEGCVGLRYPLRWVLQATYPWVCGILTCEDLAVKNMMQNRHLSKSIASVGWSQFLTMVQYKMERDGKHFRKISRWYPSSQTCGCCGYKNTDVKDLSIRKWICPKCGTWHDRDVNAQQNIYKLGVKMLQDEGIKIIDGRENRVQF